MASTALQTAASVASPCLSYKAGSKSQAARSSLPALPLRSLSSLSQSSAFHQACARASASRASSLGVSRRGGVVVRAMASDGGSGGAGGGVDIWIGRLAMMGFVGAVVMEVVTGKGLLELIGVPTPLPALALVIVAATGAFTAFGVFRSSQD
ncbi:hypothetical protein CLOM_g12765 [Closterium sp. NIES-68]|nr:hypothetical protein CLOM_g12765 [Closterium sp. NIES-68]GJP75935.1 hypothetical protein CLOP_g6333 [Closterium sp. NIES-67]